MLILHNRISNKELKANLLTEIEPRITISFYKYFTINNPLKVRDTLYLAFSNLNIFGRIYLAYEGINAQVSIPQSKIETFRQYLYTFHPALNKLRLNFALDNSKNSFWVLRLKVRKRIVADGINDPSFNANNIGKYLTAAEVNNTLDDPDAIFIDMRNSYEYAIGHFENALEIPANTFREQLLKVIKIMQKYKNKKIIMYCTGGIRCEKASAWMKHNGFNNVWHIEGGIIGYINYARMQGLPIRFIGKNFVFDERMSEKVSNDIIAHCHQCGIPCDTYINCNNNSCHLLFIQCSSCALKFKGYCSQLCQKHLIKALPKIGLIKNN